MTPAKIAAFWSHVDVRTADGCWLWTGAINHNGYGIFAVDGKKVARAHRVAYNRRAAQRRLRHISERFVVTSAAGEVVVRTDDAGEAEDCRKILRGEVFERAVAA